MTRDSGHAGGAGTSMPPWIGNGLLARTRRTIMVFGYCFLPEAPPPVCPAVSAHVLTSAGSNEHGPGRAHSIGEQDAGEIPARTHLIDDIVPWHDGHLAGQCLHPLHGRRIVW